MSHLPKLDVLDADGAIRDAAEDAGLDRSDFIKKSVLAGGGLLAGSALFGPVLAAEARISSRRSAANDVKILNFALTLEFLEAEFYRLALKNKVFGTNAQLKRFTEVVAEHEADHVTLLRGALGSKAVKKPKFEFKERVTDQAMFQKTSQELEDTGVTAYLGQAARILQPKVLVTAGRIVTVEARHAAWIRFINNPADAMTSTKNLPAPKVLDTPASEGKVLSAATKFIVP